MRKSENQWDYEMSEPVQETYREDEYAVPEEYGGLHNGGGR